jgi:hypothetical protein
MSCAVPAANALAEHVEPATIDVMKVIVFVATGMVGQEVLRECLLAPDVAA